MKSLLVGLLICSSFWAHRVALGQDGNKEAWAQEDSLMRLYDYLEQKQDYHAEHLLFAYMEKLGSEGEFSLTLLTTLYILHPTQARQVFDYLLNSQNHEVVANALDELTVRYAYICKVKQLNKVKILAKSEDEHIKSSATRFLRVIEEKEGATQKTSGRKKGQAPIALR